MRAQLRMLSRVVVVGAALVGAGCGGSKQATTPRDSPPTQPQPPRYVKKASIAWAVQPVGTRQRVFLSITDEAGRAQSSRIGDFDGTCTMTGAKPAQRALTTILCKAGGSGYELDAVDGIGTIIVLKMIVDEGIEPDLMAREELTRIPVPVDAKVEAGN